MSSLYPPTSTYDKNSFANNHQVKVEHYDIYWNANFEWKQLIGHVIVTARIMEESVEQMVLDARCLEIQNVLLNDQKVPWIQPSDESREKEGYPKVYGNPLIIDLRSFSLPKDSVIHVRVQYNTTEHSEAIQWLTKEQTAGKQYPYLFTQSQPIHARSMLPCQDTPSSKATYTSHISCQLPLVAVMSALHVGKDIKDNMAVYHFSQKMPIPTYLIAIGIGNLKSVALGPRSMLWSEEQFLEAGAYEFANTEKFIKTAEEFLPEYAWERYDLLLLPPSFPYGGMENPMLTFVTPTLLAGDRSLETIIAHEISHSWSGNLVTNQNWECFWLNEGFTVYIERRIIARLTSEQEAELDSQVHYFALMESLKHYDDMGLDEFKKLVPDLTKKDPDDAFSSVPYEKGFNFLYYLSKKIVGSTEKFEAFLKSYFTKFARKSISEHDMKKYFIEYFTPIIGEEKLKKIDWDAWLYSSGDLPIKNEFDQTLATASKKLAEKWANRSADRFEDISKWSSNQICFFLDTLLEMEPLSHETINELQETYKFTQRQNCEIRFRFLMIALKASCEKYYQDAVKLATEQGRMKFTRPLYRSLSKAKNGKELAIKEFVKHRNEYHLICSKMVARDLGL
jgi:leukotriene A-4 hydrolase/aminopeptidase